MEQVDIAARFKTNPNKFLADRARKNANEVTICLNKLSAVLRNMQILNIKHDIGTNKIDEVLDIFKEARLELIANAKQLGSK